MKKELAKTNNISDFSTPSFGENCASTDALFNTIVVGYFENHLHCIIKIVLEARSLLTLVITFPETF